MKTKQSVAVLGANGIVGRAIVRRLMRRGDLDIRPMIRNWGNAWSLAPLPLELQSVDLDDEAAVFTAFEGCDVVINCTLASSSFPDMVTHADRIVRACQHHNVQRLIHFSSVTVYGEQPSPDARREEGPVQAARNSYGWYKAAQDECLVRANTNGLSTVVLCIPHVVGAYSRLFMQLIEALRDGRFALVDDGQHHCSMVDINNVAHAVELALAATDTDGHRTFINNDDDVTWRQLIAGLAPLADVEMADVPVITAAQAKALSSGNLPLLQAARRIVSQPATKAVLRDTVLYRNERIYNSIVALRQVGRPSAPAAPPEAPTEKASTPAALEPWLCTQQLRDVRHSVARAQATLGYEPVVDFAASIQTYHQWYQCRYGYNTEWWSLTSRLLQPSEA